MGKLDLGCRNSIIGNPGRKYKEPVRLLLVYMQFVSFRSGGFERRFRLPSRRVEVAFHGEIRFRVQTIDYWPV